MPIPLAAQIEAALALIRASRPDYIILDDPEKESSMPAPPPPKLNEVDKRIWRDLSDGELVIRFWCDQLLCCHHPGNPNECGHTTFSESSLPDKAIRVRAVETNKRRVCEFSSYGNNWSGEAVV